MITPRRLAVALLLGTSLFTAACSSVPETQTTRGEPAKMASVDPWEGPNRVIFDVNDFLDRLLIRPITELYGIMIPPPIRERIAAIVKNMGEPVIMANNLLQGDFGKAGTTLSRFAVNTTLGAGGMFEVANSFGLQKQMGDFGQTLYTWGVGDGPYVVLPLLGPSTVRDAVGYGVDTAMSPWQYAARAGSTMVEDTFNISSTAASGLTRREENLESMDTLREGSLDFYAQMRSVYLQYRAKQLGKSMESQAPKFEDYEMEDRSSK